MLYPSRIPLHPIFVATIMISLQATPDSNRFDFGVNDFIDNNIDDFFDDFYLSPLPASKNAAAEDVVELLVDDNIRADLILQEDFYLRTHPLVKRDIIDLPVFEMPACTYNGKCIASAYLFYNQTSRSNFTKKSTYLRDYLALTQETLIHRLQDVITFAGGLVDGFEDIFSKIDIEKIFSLFQTMTVEERRVGFMFEGMRNWGKMRARLLVPWYYRERNFILTEKEQEVAEAELAEAFGFESGSEEEQEQFQNDHFISDKLGFGDTRFELDYSAYEGCVGSMLLGIQLTLPTAFAFKKGIRGNHFTKPCGLPTFDTIELLCIATDDNLTLEQKTEQVFNIVSPFFLEALDRLSANLLESELGNGGHVGFGALMRTNTNVARFLEKFSEYERIKVHCPWIECLTWQSRMSLEWLTPRTKKRFYIEKNDPDTFSSRNFNSTDPVVQRANLAFLEQEFVNKIHPSAFNVTVSPGLIFHSTNKLCYQGTCWDFYAGTDTWVKMRDRLSCIQAPIEIQHSLNTRKARGFWAYQSKVHIGIVYKREREEKTSWYFALHADGPFSSSGIGSDVTLALNFDASF